MSEELKYKLQNYEVPPPSGVWDNIANELKEHNELFPVSQKLYDHEVTPPPSAWNTVSTALENFNKEQKLFSVKRINARIFKLTAAAAVMGVVLTGSIYLFNNRFSEKKMAHTEARPSNNEESLKSKPLTGDPVPLSKPGEIQPSRTPVSAFVNTHANGVNRVVRRSQAGKDDRILRNAIVNNVRSLSTDLGIIITTKPIRNEMGDIIHDTDLIHTSDNQYIDITGPNGEQTRISAKFLNVLMYLNGSNIEQFEGYFDKTFLESLIWTTRFQNWREKISQTSFVPSSTNFLDILEFKDLLMKDKVVENK